VSEEWRQLALTAQELGCGYTACLLGDPIACAGMRIDAADRTGEAWSLFSPVIKAMPLSLFRIVSKGLNEVIAEEKLKLVWSIIDPNNETAVRFIRHLGFERHLRLTSFQDLYEKHIGGA
jgi:hypothetical protein